MFPRLYILMRTDMDSLNPGKAMAQAAHAANAFSAEFIDAESAKNIYGSDVLSGYYAWKKQTNQCFGTTIVLGVNSEGKLREVVNEATNGRMVAETILDPTYPIKDGYVTHLISVNTCGYVFVHDDFVYEKYKYIFENLKLHP